MKHITRLGFGLAVIAGFVFSGVTIYGVYLLFREFPVPINIIAGVLIAAYIFGWMTEPRWPEPRVTTPPPNEVNNDRDANADGALDHGVFK
ncbi:MAG: hypothetical protein ACXAAP_14800 [Candidatus Thorarchaeota archaeon]|jgi:hypothetical protein